MQSLTAPDAAVVTRKQETNVTQIFQKATGISYAKMANMGTLSGLNVAGQQSNVMNELDFQVGVKMAEMGADLEYTLLNGKHNKATTDSQVNKTRGFVEAIKTNVIEAGSKGIDQWVNQRTLCKAVREKGGDTSSLIMLVST